MVGKRPITRNGFDFAKGSVLQLDLLFPKTAPKRSVLVSGTIRDRVGQPIPYTYILDRSSKESAVSDSLGVFRLTSFPVGGTIPLSIRRADYLARDTIAEPGNANAILVRIHLDSAHANDTLRTEPPAAGYFEALDRNGYYRRRSLAGEGTFITTDAIDRRSPHRITEMLREIPNIEVISPRGMSGEEDFPATADSGCTLPLVLDGQPIRYYTGDALDSSSRPQVNAVKAAASGQADSTRSIDTFAALVPPDLIVGIEVYSRPSAVPKELQRYAGDCGLVIAWTKS
jgi:hypothetical protein